MNGKAESRGNSHPGTKPTRSNPNTNHVSHASSPTTTPPSNHNQSLKKLMLPPLRHGTRPTKLTSKSTQAIKISPPNNTGTNTSSPMPMPRTYASIPTGHYWRGEREPESTPRLPAKQSPNPPTTWARKQRSLTQKSTVQ